MTDNAQELSDAAKKEFETEFETKAKSYRENKTADSTLETINADTEIIYTSIILPHGEILGSGKDRRTRDSLIAQRAEWAIEVHAEKIATFMWEHPGAKLLAGKIMEISAWKPIVGTLSWQCDIYSETQY